MAHSNFNTNANRNKKNKRSPQSHRSSNSKVHNNNHNSHNNYNHKKTNRTSSLNSKSSSKKNSGISKKTTKISDNNMRSISNFSNFSNMSHISNISNVSNMPIANFSTGAAVYPERLRKRNVRINNGGKQKFYNRRQVIVSGKELTTPLKKRGHTVAQNKAKTDVSIKVTTINIKGKTFPVSTIFYIVIVMGVFLLMMYSLMVLNECTDDISVTKAKIVTAQKEESYLMFQLDTKNNLIEFEKRAIELGMIKEDSLPKKYVSLKNKDKVEILRNNESIFTKIAEIFPQIFSDAP